MEMLYPTSMGQAAEQAHLHEMALEAFAKRHWLSPKGIQEESSYGGHGAISKGGNQLWQKNGLTVRHQSTPPLAKALTMDKKRQLGLCFLCGEKFGPGHQCKRMLLTMEGQREEVENEVEEEQGE